jgi:cytochrome c peroxidase
MKKYIITIAIAFVIVGIHSSFKQKEASPFGLSFREYFTKQTDSLLNIVLELYYETEKKDFNPVLARELLSKSRLTYKTIEAYAIYFFPGDARYLNRPVIAEMEEDDEVSPIVVPHGFQVIEQMLYGDSVLLLRKKIRDEVDFSYVIINRFKEFVDNLEVEEHFVYEAMQMHLIRQFMLGLADFETGDSRAGRVESAGVLAAYNEFLQEAFKEKIQNSDAAFVSFFNASNRAIEFLSQPVKDNFDFFTFYSAYYIPLSEGLVRIRFQNSSGDSYNTIPVNYHVRSIFDPGAFNTDFFLPAKQMHSREKVIDLGRTLFFDPALSANNLRACASCHQPGKAFTDGLALSEAFEPGKKLTRNAPTIINAVLQRKLFHDGRSFTFEDQAGQVMNNPLEMHGDFSTVAKKIKASDEYVKLFKFAFNGYEDTLITSRSILTAIAEYERSLTGLNSRFDKTITGRDNLMNEDEKEGFNIYMGKANCGSCHFIPLFNGSMPPEYVDTEWEIIGVPSSKIAKQRELDSDMGRAGVINVDVFRHAFKSSTIRNIELTGPYMHNGVFKTLEEVVEFYNHGGGINLGYDVPLQTLPTDSLRLTEREKFQLIAFMKTLTDTVNLTGVPDRLPYFPENSDLNSRPIGGEY